MRPIPHFIVSSVIGAGFWIFTGSAAAAFLVIASGVLIDFDHIVEYLLHFGVKDLSFGNVYRTSEDTCKPGADHGFTKVRLIFHIAEVAIGIWILWFITRNVYVLAIAVGYTSHLVLDYFGNPPKANFYFFTWRYIKKFSSEHFFRENSKR